MAWHLEFSAHGSCLEAILWTAEVLVEGFLSRTWLNLTIEARYRWLDYMWVVFLGLPCTSGNEAAQL